jgi:Domain of unknown function (DUF3576)
MTRKRSWTTAGAAAALLVSAVALSACGSDPDRQDGQSRLGDSSGGGGFLGIGGKKKEVAGDQIGVNSFLWRASLDTLRFMPLVSADAFGGTIITDWYANPEAPRERFKATVYILDTRLRADGLNVSVNRQTLTANGWLDAPSDPDVAIQLENKILVRARELRLSTLPN